MSDAPLMLGVSGLRGVVGKSLLPQTAARYGAALGRWFSSQRRRGTESAAHVVIGRDSRPSGESIETATVSGLLASGCRVTRSGVVTTPGVAVMVGHLGADGGVIVTASHNPEQWNGIKALRHDGIALAADQVGTVIDDFTNDRSDYAVDDAGTASDCDQDAGQVHIARVLSHIDSQAIRNRGLKVVLDSVNGAGGPETASLMRQLGVELVHLNAEPTGQFTHPPEPSEANLVDLCRAVPECGADLGFAQDPDGDRLAIVDEAGMYIGEEYTLSLSAMHVLDTAGGGAGSVMAANLSTSRMIDDVADRAQARVIRTPVGEANVAAAMCDHNALVGGEGNGGVIWPVCSHVRDSLAAAALVLEMLARRNVPLSDIVGSMPRYAMIKHKVQINDTTRSDIVGSLSSTLQAHLDAPSVDCQDGVRLDWPDRWVHVRPSNTEPVLRIIAEAPDDRSAADLVDKVRQALAIS